MIINIILQDFESSPCSIFYTVNGESQGTAFEFDKETLEGAALFPHILSRNCCYLVNYGHEEYNLLTKTKVIKRQVEAVKDEKSGIYLFFWSLLIFLFIYLQWFIIFSDQKEDEDKEKTEEPKIDNQVCAKLFFCYIPNLISQNY